MKLIVPALLLSGLIAAGVIVVSVERSNADDGAGREAIHLPERTAAAPPAPVEPPPVPAAAEALPPLTATLTTVWDGPHGARHEIRQVITRTSDRVRLVLDGAGKEWLFERNALHPTRVSGHLVDHAAHQILEYDESELRAAQRLRGWADVLMMRFDPEALRTLEATGERRTVDGIVFSRHAARDARKPGIVEVWWSDTLLLAQRLVVREADSVITSMITRVDRAVDRSALASPEIRFPDYERTDPGDAGDHRH